MKSSLRHLFSRLLTFSGEICASSALLFVTLAFSGCGKAGNPPPPEVGTVAQEVAKEPVSPNEVRLYELIEIFTSPDMDSRLLAITTVGKLGPDAKEAVPHLMGLLEHEHRNTRILAANALGKIGFSAKEALPALRKNASAAELAEKIICERAVRQIEN